MPDSMLAPPEHNWFWGSGQGVWELRHGERS